MINLQIINYLNKGFCILMVKIKYRAATAFISRRKYFIAFMNIMKVLVGIVLSFKVPNPAHNPTPYLKKKFLFLFVCCFRLG